ncbi:AIPR family protein [Hamadaea sp. NPDC050747]|uniref:AIPR family protein n=1 Tax=Hamadaea sp. NPDC050747 TaxID=3155789 RepID=UPI0033CF4350
MTTADRSEYAREIVADVLATAESENASAAETFTQRVLEDLEQGGEVENTFTAYHRARGVEASGYGVNETLGSLDLFVTFFTLEPLTERLTRQTADNLLRRLNAFARRCTEGLAADLDESSDLHDMCLAVEKGLKDATRVRLFVLSNAEYTGSAFPPTEIDGVSYTHEIWDLARLHRMATSGTLSEPITVEFQPVLPCLTATEAQRDYSVLLAIVPGKDLAELYSRYGTRLLELNVRSFLQTKGGVNRGIRDTLLNDPERFLAYNNGITATAATVEFEDRPDGGRGIRRLTDFQIVNGGQTTASIHYAHRRDKADLQHVHVQMKLTVVSPDRLQQIVPEISKYSNTQNKVTIVDFSSNHPYHVAVEKITRSLWAPAADGSGQETKWFYERARGQYADALARERTPANQRKFRALHPVAQKFSKADLAKFLHSWEGLPHFVSRGAEKNFREFMMRMGEAPPDVDIKYCKHLVAKAILFKATDKIVQARSFGGYKINVVAYTVGRLAYSAGTLIDMERIWREQRLPPALVEAIDTLCVEVHKVIASPQPQGSNVGEWAKKVECWNEVLAIDWDVPQRLADEAAGSDEGSTAIHGEASRTVVTEIPAEIWFAASKWAKETNHLQPWQRQIAYTVGRYLTNGWELSDKQLIQAERLMGEARRLGFDPQVPGD